MSNVHLVLNPTFGVITATSLGISDFVWHRSPGTSGKFHGRSILIDLALKDGYPSFRFQDEGGWRDADGDSRRALDAARQGKRTKTALSNGAFSCTPISAYEHIYLSKSGGEVLELQQGVPVATFTQHVCPEKLGTDELAEAAGLPKPATRVPRCYLIISPVEMLILSNLTPAEYAWYATHRTGKVFRQLLFVELAHYVRDLAARETFETAHRELTEMPTKKTKTITQGDCFGRVPFSGWKGYNAAREEGGLYGGDSSGISVWRFPVEIPHYWERAL